jgi:hypothetical protein
MSKTPVRNPAEAPIAPPLSLREVAALFGRTPRTIRTWVSAGLLTPLPIPRGPYFSRDEIRALCEHRRTSGTSKNSSA